MSLDPSLRIYRYQRERRVHAFLAAGFLAAAVIIFVVLLTH